MLTVGRRLARLRQGALQYGWNRLKTTGLQGTKRALRVVGESEILLFFFSD